MGEIKHSCESARSIFFYSISVFIIAGATAWECTSRILCYAIGIFVNARSLQWYQSGASPCEASACCSTWSTRKQQAACITAGHCSAAASSTACHCCRWSSCRDAKPWDARASPEVPTSTSHTRLPTLQKDDTCCGGAGRKREGPINGEWHL